MFDEQLLQEALLRPRPRQPVPEYQRAAGAQRRIAPDSAAANDYQARISR